MKQVIQKINSRPWLSAGTLWVLAGASATLNAWGWSQNPSMVAIVLVALAIASEVLGLRYAEHAQEAFESRRWPQLLACGLILAGVVGFNAYSGHRAFELVEAQRLAPYSQAVRELDALIAVRTDAQAQIAAIEAKIPAPMTSEQMATMPAVRIAAAQAARDVELARLMPQLHAAQAALAALGQPVAAPTEPPPAMPSDTIWAIVVLLEALKALGMWAIGASRKPAAPTAAPQIDLDQIRKQGNPVHARWAKHRAAKAAA